MVAHLLRDRVGVFTFVNARQVCHGWAEACNEDGLLLAVAGFCDGLTRTQFRGLLRMSAEEAGAYPCKARRTHGRDGASREFYLYSVATVKRALQSLGGMQSVRHRPPMLTTVRCPASPSDAQEQSRSLYKRKRAHELEEFLHKRMMTRVLFEASLLAGSRP